MVSLGLGWLLPFLFTKAFQLFVATPFFLLAIIIVLILIFLFVRTFLATFHWVAWALIFESMTDKKGGFRGFLDKLF